MRAGLLFSLHGCRRGWWQADGVQAAEASRLAAVGLARALRCPFCQSERRKGRVWLPWASRVVRRAGVRSPVARQFPLVIPMFSSRNGWASAGTWTVPSSPGEPRAFGKERTSGRMTVRSPISGSLAVRLQIVRRAKICRSAIADLGNALGSQDDEIEKMRPDTGPLSRCKSTPSHTTQEAELLHLVDQSRP